MPLNSKKLDEANKRISELEKKIKDINNEATESNFTFIDMAKNISDVAKSAVDFKGAIEDSSKLAGSLSKEAQILARFTKEDLKDKKKMLGFQNAADKLLKKRTEIESQISILNIKKAGASLEEKEAIEKTVKILQDGIKESDGLVGNFDKIAKTNSKLNSETKYWDALSKTLKTIPGVGPLIAGPFEDASKAMRKARVNEEGFFKSAGKGVLELGKAFGPAYLLGTIINADSHIVEMQRSLQLSTSEARNLHERYTDIALESGNALHNQKNLLEAHTQLSKELGVTSGFSEDMVKNQAKLTKRLGVSEKSAAKFAKYQATTGKSAKETNLEIADSVANLRKETGISVKLSEVFEEVANTNAGLKAAYGFNNKLLAEQVLKTKAIGINMAQAEKIASGMLDFESSIQAELEAELLTGKSLNLEKARSLALSGKSSEAAAEILNQVGSSNDLAKMNVIQQEALAKAVGMERNELIASVKEREVLAKLGGKSLEEQLKNAKTEKERNEIKKKFLEGGGEELLQAYERESQAEKFEAVVIKIQNAISGVAERLSPVINFFADLLNSSAGLYGTMIAIVGVIGTSLYLKTAAWIGQITTANLLSKKAKEEAMAQSSLKKEQIAEETALNVEKGVGSGISKTDLGTEEAKLLVQKGTNTQKKQGIGLSLRNLAISAKDLVKSVGNAIMKAFIWLGPIGGAIAATAIGFMAYKYMNDGVIGPGGEMVVSGPKGSIQLDKDDSIIAGTDLGGKKEKKSGGGARRDAALIAKIDQLISINQQILAKSPVIEMGGNQVGQGINTAEREVQ